MHDLTPSMPHVISSRGPHLYFTNDITNSVITADTRALVTIDAHARSTGGCIRVATYAAMPVMALS
jgi:phosphoserine aminotransferase